MSAAAFGTIVVVLPLTLLWIAPLQASLSVEGGDAAQQRDRHQCVPHTGSVVCCPAGRCWCLRAAECLQLRLHNARVATDSLLVSELGQDWHLLLYCKKIAR